MNNLIEASRAAFRLYYNGSKQLYRNSKAAAALVAEQKKAAREGRPAPSWSRQDFLLVKQTSLDMRKLPLFLVLAIVLPESIPFVLKFAPSMIPSTCVSADQLAKMRLKLSETRRTVASGWLAQMKLDASSNSPNSKSSLGWTSQVPPSHFLNDENVLNLAKHAPQYFVPSNMTRQLLVDINKSLGLSHRSLFNSTLAKGLSKHWETIKGDDEYLRADAGGDAKTVHVTSLTDEELMKAAEMRGM
ncbi:hypothetical protein HDU83_007325 [Entophlyctis luteolus]|nr:hypothetical protein HDU82_001317 [Entophlyctis luteolus]KAJ3357394.1 hypothetical protein HDU83_007325 [Entophlyctis luteolus]KAJ3394897.1 hypothetical protein HDU84_005832 [Entophlyctis sp. JEL0112]